MPEDHAAGSNQHRKKAMEMKKCLATPCYALLRLATPCYALLRLATPCYALLRLAAPCCALLRLATPCYLCWKAIRPASFLSKAPTKAATRPADCGQQHPNFRAHRPTSGLGLEVAPGPDGPLFVAFSSAINPLP